jgi:glucokinase
VATVVNLLLPDVVVLGGGLVEAMPKLFAVHVAESARAHVLPAYALQFEVRTSELGDDASVMGAAAWVQHTVASGMK